MISDNMKNRISLVCYATVSHLFSMYLNEKYRGPNFTWVDFPEKMEEQCEMQVILNIRPTRNKEEILCHARDTGREIAGNMVKWMTE